MKTTVKIENGSNVCEAELTVVDGKQMVTIEFAELLAILDGKAAAPKAKKVGRGPAKKSAKVAKAAPDAEPASKPAGAKRGRKPRIVSGAFSGEAVTDPSSF
jgi:hypothetical protein